MADGETQGRYAPHAKRLRALRKVMGYSESQQAFAKFLEISPQRYNNFENGTPLSIDAAKIICRKAQGVTLDWLYRDVPDGLPVKLARDLQAAEGSLEPVPAPDTAKSGKTSPRASKRRGGPSRKKPSTS
jgi:transcriptional regulator with XRE-family HTH domain